MQTDGGAGPNGKMSARNIGLQFLTRGLHQSMWLRGPPLPPSHSIRSVTAVLVGSWVGSDADSEGRVRVCVCPMKQGPKAQQLSQVFLQVTFCSRCPSGLQWVHVNAYKYHQIPIHFSHTSSSKKSLRITRDPATSNCSPSAWFFQNSDVTGNNRNARHAITGKVILPSWTVT